MKLQHQGLTGFKKSKDSLSLEREKVGKDSLSLEREKVGVRVSKMR
jgi:hypothetical protein